MRITGWKLASLVALVVVLGGSASVIHRRLRERRFRDRLDRATALLKDQRLGEARRLLLELDGERPDHPEVVYHIGVSEYARGNLTAAAKAWSRLPLDTPQGGLAYYYRARLAISRGRFAEAEDLLDACVGRPGPHAGDARWELVKLLRIQGRFEEARRLFIQGIQPDENLPGMVRRLYSLDVNPVPVEQLRTTLETAASQAPDDDRVWLATGHLALVQGRLDEADRRLAACEARRPQDPAVARIRLKWAMTASRPDSVRARLGCIPADADDPETRAFALEVAAWLARHGGDTAAERRILERRLSLLPLDAPALERLAELASRDRLDLVASYRERKQKAEPLRARYEELLGAREPGTHAAELEILSRQLGRLADARLWRRFLDRRQGDHALPAREQDSPSGPTIRLPRVTLADLVGEAGELEPVSSIAGGPAAVPPRSAAEPAISVPRFTDDAGSAGLDFIHHNGDVGKRLIPPVTASGGVALLDYDRDGWLDVFVVQGGAFPFDPGAPHDGDRLFRNRGDGTWEDATASSGIAALRRGYGHGVTVGDYDGDGHPDLFVTRWRGYALYRNRGDGTFEDRTEAAGLGGDRDWPTSAAFADLDGDGDLDLYVCHYMQWDETDTRTCVDPDHPEIFRCTPLNFPALPDHLFRNDGGRFLDVTAEAGIRDIEGRGLGVLAADLDEDGRVDLFVANDMTADYLFLNRGGFRFEEVAHAAGVAGNASGGYQAGMGVACGDLNGDGLPDLVVTNFYNEGTTYFENLGQGLFADRSDAAGIRVPSRYLLGFGVALLDANNDGWLDLVSANGHVNDGRPSYPWKMPVQLLAGTGAGRMIDVTRRAGEPFLVDRLGRGLAAGDLDNDGRVDFLVQSQNEPLAYFHNNSGGSGHYLRLRLEGRTSNRDAIGARVRVVAGSRRWSLQRTSGGSFQSSGDPRLLAGLGPETTIDEIQVDWPSGRRDRFSTLAADREYLVVEGEPIRPVASSVPGAGPRPGQSFK